MRQKVALSGERDVTGQNAIDIPQPNRRATVLAGNRPLRCLMMDDSSFDRRLIRATARGCARQIEFIETSAIAGTLDRIANERPDICIFDLKLPDGDGLDLVRELGRDPVLASIPVIAIGHAEDKTVAAAAMEAGAAGFLAKRRLTPAMLEAAIARALPRAETSPAPEKALDDDTPQEPHSPALGHLGRLKSDVLKLLAQSWKLIDAGAGASDAERGKLSQLTRAAVAHIDDLTIDAAIGPDAGPTGPLSLTALLRESVDALAGTLRASEARVSATALPEVFGVSAEFRLLFEQFLLHALRYPRLGTGPLIEFGGGRARDGSWTLWYRDGGVSLPARLQSDQRVFDANDANDGAAAGPVPAGFGLSVCQRIVERNGGSLSIFGEKDGGCRVVMRFDRPTPEESEPGKPL